MTEIGKVVNTYVACCAQKKAQNHSGDNSVIEVNTSTYAQSPKSRQPVNTDRYVDESLNEVLRTLINDINCDIWFRVILFINSNMNIYKQVSFPLCA